MTKRRINLPAAAKISETVRRALDEDIGSGDLTAALVDKTLEIEATLVCRDHAVLCGSAWFEEVFRQTDETIRIEWYLAETDLIKAGQEICVVRGRAQSILTAERTALNLLQTLSGTATTTRRYVRMIDSSQCRLLDTRKTIPGLRLEQKYAVAVGGAANHRIGLYDGILIKENHIESTGSIEQAVKQALATAPDCRLIEVEVESISELQQALDAGANRILLDNFSIEMLEQAVSQNGGRAELEASGNVNQETIRQIAASGVDFISIGALTKHLHAIDFSLRF